MGWVNDWESAYRALVDEIKWANDNLPDAEGSFGAHLALVAAVGSAERIAEENGCKL